MGTPLYSIGLVLLGCAVGAMGPIFIKKATDEMSLRFRSIVTNRNLIMGVGLYGLSTLIFIPALKEGELSVIYPFVSVSYILVSLLSIRFLGEKMNRQKWTGIALIILGVSLIGLGSV